MSIDQAGVIDAIGIDDSTGQTVLTISDHLEWDKDHLFLLQEKLNTYLSFVESGEIFQAYPNSKGREVLIKVICKYPPDQSVESYLKQIEKIVESAGIKFMCRVFTD